MKGSGFSNEMHKETRVNSEIEELKEKISDKEDEIKILEANENEDEYDEYLDDVFGDCEVAGMKMQTSRVLKEMDEVAYNQGMSEFNDNKISELHDELNDLKSDLKDLEGEE
jgi:hypothetical protein